MLVNFPSGDVVVAGQGKGQVPLIVAKIQVNLGT